MARKYIKDYRVEHVLTPNGKRKPVPVYCGDWFIFVDPADRIRRAAAALCVLTLAVIATLIPPLVVKTNYSEQLYITLPLLFLIPPVYMFCTGLYRIWTAKEKVTREHKDKIDRRISQAAVFLLVVSLLLIPGSVVYLFVSDAPLTAVDWLCEALVLLRLIPAILSLRLRGRFAMQQCPAEPKAK